MFPFYPIEREIKIVGFHNTFEDRLAPDFVFRGESHENYELLLLFEGSAGVTSGSDSFIIDAPAALLYPPMCFHAIRAEKGTSPLVRVFEFEASAFPEYSNTLFVFSEENQQRAKRIFKLVTSSAEMYDMHVLAPRKGCERQLQQAVCELELMFLSFSEESSPPAPANTTKSMRHFTRALGIIKDNLSHPLNTDDIARLAGISPSLLKKLFTRYTGMGVMEYFRTQKINAAIPLLKDGWNVSEVSAHLGFSDPSYFSTVFKKITGHSPTFYKNN